MQVDVVAAFVQKGGTVYDLEEAELCYGGYRGGGRGRREAAPHFRSRTALSGPMLPAAPQFNSAKDPLNLAGGWACWQLLWLR
jgi:hypothetical protein